MRKSETLARNAKSLRNRHNGRVNFATKNLIAAGQTFAMSDGKRYSTFVTKVVLPPSPDDNMTVGEDGVITREKKFLIKTQTARIKS